MHIEELSSEPYVSFYHPRVDFDLRQFLRSSDLLLALLDSITYSQYQRDAGRDELTLVNMFSGSILPFKPRPVVLPFGLPALQEEPVVEEIVADDAGAVADECSWVTVPATCADLDLSPEWQILV